MAVQCMHINEAGAATVKPDFKTYFVHFQAINKADTYYV